MKAISFSTLAWVAAVVLACAPVASPSPPAPVQPPSLVDVVGAGQQATYKVVYKLSGTSGGRSLSGEKTTYAMPPKRRVDTSGGNTQPVSIYDLGDRVYWCAPCVEIPRDQSIQLEEMPLSSPEGLETTYQGTRQIVDQEAHCYGVKPRPGGPVEFTEVTFCASIQGVPLLSQIKFQSMDIRTDRTWEAISYSASVSDADFQLPSQPMRFPPVPGSPPGSAPRQ